MSQTQQRASLTNDDFEKGAVAHRPSYYEYDTSTLAGDCTCCTSKVSGIVFICLGILFTAIGIAAGTILPWYVNNQIQSGVRTCSLSDISNMTEYTKPYDDHCESCVPYYNAFHPFTVTNVGAFAGDKTSLNLKELGPFVYRKFTTKSDISFTSNTVSYKSIDRYEYQPSMSCENCSESDIVSTIDTAYLNVMTGAKGEDAFVSSLIAGLGQRLDAPDDSIDQLITYLGFKQSLLKVINAINSLDVNLMKKGSDAVAELLNAAADPSNLVGAATSLAQMTFTEEEMNNGANGLITKRTVSQLATGYPSVTAGLAVVSSGMAACSSVITANNFTSIEEAAAFCSTTTTNVECSSCLRGLAVKDLTVKSLCPSLKQHLLTQTTNKTLVDEVINNTCGLCESSNLFCLAPIPGFVTGSASTESTELYTGCDNIDDIATYKLFEGMTERPIWVNPPTTRNPSVNDIQSFSRDCQNDQTTCAAVTGGDGASFPPAGADVTGFASSPIFNTRDLYVSQALQNVTVSYTNEVVTTDEIDLHRFRPDNKILDASELNVQLGTGVPYDGVQNLGYSTGFLSYVSFPFFIHGEDALHSKNVQITNKAGVNASDMYADDGSLLEEYQEMYGTFIDIEVATGKAMNARKRLQASFGIGALDDENTTPITNLLWKEIVPGSLVIPIYWGEESATITPLLALRFRGAAGMAALALPVLISGIIGGLIFILVGVYCLRKRK